MQNFPNILRLLLVHATYIRQHVMSEILTSSYILTSFDRKPFGLMPLARKRVWPKWISGF